MTTLASASGNNLYTLASEMSRPIHPSEDLDVSGLRKMKRLDSGLPPVNRREGG